MKRNWRDIVSTALVVVGAVTMFAKLESYTWWLIGSWTGALGVLAVLGLGILLTNVRELTKTGDLTSFFESFLWLITATVVVTSLATATTKAEFVASGSLIGLSWLAQVTRHLWHIGHHGSHYVAAH